MTAESLRTFCLSLPHATEDIKWGNDLCFLVAKKLFAITMLERSADYFVSFKCTPEQFAELIEVEGIIPAAYMARIHWVTVQRADVLRDSELRELIRKSYDLVAARLPKRMQTRLATTSVPPPSAKKRAPAKKKKASR